MLEYFKDKSLDLILSIIYVGIGTISVCSVYPSDSFYGEWSWWGIFVTLPVSIISFMYRYADAGSLIPVFIIQIIMVYPTYLVFKSIMKIFYKKRNPSPDILDDI